MKYKHGRNVANDLSQQTFSIYVVNLRNGGFADEGQDTDNRKKKMYRINDMGVKSFRFFADPVGNSIVKMAPENS